MLAPQLFGRYLKLVLDVPESFVEGQLCGEVGEGSVRDLDLAHSIPHLTEIAALGGDPIRSEDKTVAPRPMPLCCR